MNILVLFYEMVVVFAMILVGYWLGRKKILGKEGVSVLSYLVVNVCNPCMILNASFQYEGKLDGSVFVSGLTASLIVHAILIALSIVLPIFFRIDSRERYAYHMLTIYGNVGFIGFPVCTAVLGPASTVFVSIHVLVFNLLIYTYGEYEMRRARVLNHLEDAAKNSLNALNVLKLAINVGTLSSIIAIVVYLIDPPIHQVLRESASFIGGCTVFLSMLVLGYSISTAPIKNLFANGRLLVYSLVRLLPIPIILVLLLGRMFSDPMLMGVMAIEVALPGAAMPLMMVRQSGLPDEDMSRGILLTTLFSIITIPLVCLFL